MIIIFEDTEIVRSILARIALYSASLLEVGKSNRRACSVLSPVGDLNCRPTPALVC